MISLLGILFGRSLIDDVHHLPLDGLLLQNEPVLVPDEVRRLGIDVVLLHAPRGR